MRSLVVQVQFLECLAGLESAGLRFQQVDWTVLDEEGKLGGGVAKTAAEQVNGIYLVLHLSWSTTALLVLSILGEELPAQNDPP